MRFKISLNVIPEVSGDVLPISYQHELATVFANLIHEDKEAFRKWETDNGLFNSAHIPYLYSISNLYVPKILVENDRLRICVPRIQFWVSFIPEIGTRDLLKQQLLNRKISIGDSFSSVHFQICDVSDVSPVEFLEAMEYQTLSPVVIKAYRANHTLEYLSPSNHVFPEFMIEDLIERWEHFYNCPYSGNRTFSFTPLTNERRKAVTVFADTPNRQKVVGYMLKFRLEMDPVLQEFAYVSGLGNEIDKGFGYIELIRKRK